ncbi:MAG: PRC-barrel domain containing protein [Desulfobacteraceae bacterium]|nr:MAG: PRC-barrel domain containing protein [Desulfobacteraceae bacterium]
MKSKIGFMLVGLMIALTLSVGPAFAGTMKSEPKAGAAAEDPMKYEPKAGATDPMKADPKAGAAADTEKFDQKAGATSGMKSGKNLTGSHRGSEFMNKKVKNDKGENLGNVKDFIFDRDGELSYIVVSEAAGDKMHPIPFTSGMVKFEGDSVVLSNVDKSKLENAPTFGSTEWNKLDDPAFESKIHGYYKEGAGEMKGGASTEMKGGATGDQMKKDTFDPMKKSIPEKKY